LYGLSVYSIINATKLLPIKTPPYIKTFRSKELRVGNLLSREFSKCVRRSDSTYFIACVSDVVFLSILNIRRKFIQVEEQNF